MTGDAFRELVGGAADLAWVGVKAVLLFLTAVIGLRLSGRRTLASLTPVDFVAAVAVGAIVGRIPNASSTSYLAGAATLVAVLATHAVVVRLRRWEVTSRVVARPPRVVVRHGVLLDDALDDGELGREELLAQLRSHGVARLSQVGMAVLESSGSVSVIRTEDLVGPDDTPPDLLPADPDDAEDPGERPGHR